MVVVETGLHRGLEVDQKEEVEVYIKLGLRHTMEGAVQ